MKETESKEDLYYANFMIMAGVMASTAAILIKLDAYAISIVFFIFAVIAYSMGTGTKYDGYHKRFWEWM